MCFDRRPPDSDDEFESAFEALILHSDDDRFHGRDMPHRSR